MWRRQILNPQQNAWHFAVFINTAKYRDLTSPPTLGKRKDTIPNCLLDVIELWVVYGNGAIVCPTYEIFLMTVLEIINSWALTDRREAFGSGFFPNDEGDERRQMLRLLSDPGDSHDSSEHLPVDYMANHTVLNRDNFLMQQAQARALRGRRGWHEESEELS